MDDIIHDTNILHRITYASPHYMFSVEQILIISALTRTKYVVRADDRNNNIYSKNTRFS